MKQIFKGQISSKAVFLKCVQARYYYGVLVAADLGWHFCFDFGDKSKKLATLMEKVAKIEE